MELWARDGAWHEPIHDIPPSWDEEVHQEVAVNVAHKAVTTVHGKLARWSVLWECRWGVQYVLARWTWCTREGQTDRERREKKHGTTQIVSYEFLVKIKKNSNFRETHMLLEKIAILRWSFILHQTCSYFICGGQGNGCHPPRMSFAYVALNLLTEGQHVLLAIQCDHTHNPTPKQTRKTLMVGE